MATTPASAAAVPPRPTSAVRRSRAVEIGVWTFQALLALVFLAHGGLLLYPPPEIAAQMNATLPRSFWIFLGVAEVLAFFGLTLPVLVRTFRWLMAWAAGGIMIVMVSATVYHVARRELGSAAITVVLLGMATVVAQARRRDYPTRPQP
jgi:DoxX-like protein